MRKLFLAATALMIASPALAIDCSGPPYGSTMSQYENYIRVSKEVGFPSDPERTIKQLCNAKDIPGKQRQALLDVGFTYQEIAETDTVELFIKYTKRLRQVLHGEDQ
jgi:hypothetical protein